MDQAVAARQLDAQKVRHGWISDNWGLLLGAAVLAAILLLPTPPGLSVAGQRMLAVFGFAVIVWMTDALDYAVSAVVIAALMALFLGISPNVANPKVLIGTVQGLTTAISGFGNTALTLVAAALFLAAAMTVTRLDRRIALIVLSGVGTRTSRIVMGAIVVSTVLALLVPSATARAAAVIPIIMGIIVAFGVDQKSRFAGLLMITTVQAVSIWNVGIKTAAAQNMVAIGFIQKMLGHDITWLSWLVAAGPFAVLMSVGLYLVMMTMMPPEAKEIPGGKATVEKALNELGPMTGKEGRLLALSLILLGFWSTEGVLHPLDSSTTTTIAVALLFLPGIGVMDWKTANPLIPWGTIVLFGVGISLGTALLQTQAAQWLANLIVDGFGLNQLPALAILAVMAAFLIVVHLGFASATALASSLIPIVIAVLQKVQSPGINVLGMTLVLQFVVSFGFILPVNSPQGMVGYGTGTFAARDFIRTGIVLTLLAYLLTLLFGATYWHWLGYV
ncbi:MAG TPA: DASS family sodium-coupled anion symporter [Bradyrhizobium sp.]|uniref:DASS family sodium-coupled anion symporter n=1 Tax=Bradyrhizobium sp. TaxID=376 RepID=UPI002D7FDF07|nr:DASS family sodium-coupled anion symporter [Bradyrhizobium sp.]HET7888006.1 DASS family sodium-coupled anion symporter [Bradyrhizobium sp.]